MTFTDYINKINATWAISDLNEIVELAANDENLTNDEYEQIYVTAINNVREGK